MNNISLSVIMPALNEERNIQEAVLSTLSAFNDYGVNGEIIVVNDGSSDATKQLVEEISKDHKHVRLIDHHRPMGIGYSFMDGVRKAHGDVVVMFPGDNENDPNDAVSFFKLMDQVDVVIPFVHNIEVRNKVRRTISSLYRFIINMSFGINLNYTNGTVFYRRCILDNVEINSKGFFYQAELLIRLLRKGYLYAEVPNFLSKRNTGKSKAISFKSLMNVMKNYLMLVYRIHILRVESRRQYRKLAQNSVSYTKYNSLHTGR
ncbi:MAG: glycosyltransferase family 2 protein [Pseudomonadota bacterium]